MDTDPYWNHDTEIGTATIDGEAYGIRVRLHESPERYTESSELVPITRRGERIYYHARPYILLPDIRLTVELTRPEPTGAIGQVLSSEYTGVRPVEIGEAQAWYYPQDQTLVLWECLLEDRYRSPDPLHDDALRVLWEGWEQLLIERSKGARRIVTPSWEPLYEQPA